MSIHLFFDVRKQVRCILDFIEDHRRRKKIKSSILYWGARDNLQIKSQTALRSADKKLQSASRLLEMGAPASILPPDCQIRRFYRQSALYKLSLGSPRPGFANPGQQLDWFFFSPTVC
jgi:hypothetical protein